eukprot:7388129-Prymnesium_polylepis.1
MEVAKKEAAQLAAAAEAEAARLNVQIAALERSVAQEREAHSHDRASDAARLAGVQGELGEERDARKG